MNAITSYIDHMFRALPRTVEVRRAKAELLQMCEDRYQELLAEGTSENEAVGRVITQFGNLDELADDLGIRAEYDGVDTDAVQFSDSEAQRFLQVRRRASYLIAGGVFLILAGVTALMLLGSDVTMAEPGQPALFNVTVSEPASLAVFFVAVAIAVFMFIFAGISLTRFENAEDRAIELDHETAERYRRQRAEGTTRYAVGIGSGVMTIILSLAVAALMNTFSEESNPFGIAVMFLGVGIGVAVLIITSMARTGLDQLTASGEFRPDRRESQSLIERIAGPYWMLAIAIYLIWSFVWKAWDQSWILWPIAGVLFGLIAATVEAFKTRDDRAATRR